MLAGGSTWPYQAPPDPWPAEYLSLAHNDDYGGGGSFDNYMHAFTSPDGIEWTKVGAHNLGGAVYSDFTLRDPDLLYWDGKWWACAQNTNLRILASETFVDGWALIDTPATGLLVWAPAWFVDVDQTVHVIFGGSNNGGLSFNLYEVRPTNDEMTAWSSPALIGGSGWSSKSIDPQITYWDGTYYMLWKDDNSGYISRSVSASPFSGYSVVDTGDWAGWASGSFGPSIEGPKIVDIGTGWRAYWSQNSGFDANNIWYSETVDRTMDTGWSAPVSIPSFAGYNHAMPLRRAD